MQILQCELDDLPKGGRIGEHVYALVRKIFRGSSKTNENLHRQAQLVLNSSQQLIVYFVVTPAWTPASGETVLAETYTAINETLEQMKIDSSFPAAANQHPGAVVDRAAFTHESGMAACRMHLFLFFSFEFLTSIVQL
jgi:predicted Rossmann fold nucleotide-binding protein DprA/Smf involved in DNA uptake